MFERVAGLLTSAGLAELSVPAGRVLPARHAEANSCSIKAGSSDRVSNSCSREVETMSAVLVDELTVPARALLRQARANEAADRLAAPVQTAARIAVVRELRPGRVARAAPRPPVGVQPTGDGRAWRLTDRGIAVVLTLFVALFVTGVAVIVTSFLAVSEAPLGAADSMSVVAGSAR
jgi:hypothetical protein